MTDNQNATLLHLFAIGNVFEGQHNDSSESDLQWRNQQKIGDTGQLSQCTSGKMDLSLTNKNCSKLLIVGREA